jgi:hypothetical protein
MSRPSVGPATREDRGGPGFNRGWGLNPRPRVVRARGVPLLPQENPAFAGLFLRHRYRDSNPGFRTENSVKTVWLGQIRSGTVEYGQIRSGSLRGVGDKVRDNVPRCGPRLTPASDRAVAGSWATCQDQGPSRKEKKCLW